MLDAPRQHLVEQFPAPTALTAQAVAEYFRGLHAAPIPDGLARWDDPASAHAHRVAAVQHEAAVILPAHLPVADMDVVYSIIDRAEKLWTAHCVIHGACDNFADSSHFAAGNAAADYGLLYYHDTSLPEAVAELCGRPDIVPDATAYRHWDAVAGLLAALTAEPQRLPRARRRFHAAIGEARGA